MSDTATQPLSELTGTPQQQPVFDAAERESLIADRDRSANETAQLRESNRRYEQQMAEQAVQAWRQADQQVFAAAREADPDDALRMVHDHYQRKEQFLLGTIQQNKQELHNEQLNAWVDLHIKESGLSESDRQQLLWVGQRDPEAVPAETQRLVNAQNSSRSEIDTLKQKIEQMERAQQANQMRNSGAWDTGGAQPQPVDPNIKPGSREHLKSLLGLG